MVKKPLSDELGIAEGFLGNTKLKVGLLDGLGFFWRAFGLIIILIWPTMHPKRDYLIHSCIIAFFLLLIPVSTLFPSYCEPLLVLSFVISGFSRCFNFVPFLLVNQYFDAAGKHKNIMKLWVAAVGVGDVCAVIGMSILLNNFGWNWKYAFLLAIILFLSASFLMGATT